jgi:hypothetical protein
MRGKGLVHAQSVRLREARVNRHHNDLRRHLACSKGIAESHARCEYRSGKTLTEMGFCRSDILRIPKSPSLAFGSPNGRRVTLLSAFGFQRLAECR